MKILFLLVLVILAALKPANAATFDCDSRKARALHDSAFPDQFARSFAWARRVVEADSFYQVLATRTGGPLACWGRKASQ